MSVDEITALVAPPKKPAGRRGIREWDKVAKQLPFTLPSDFKAYLDTYGEGCLGDMFYLISPFDERKGESLLDIYDEIDDEFRDNCEMEGWLEEASEVYEPGLIRFGGDTNGHRLYWLTIGAPDEWPIVIDGGWHCDRFDGPMTTFFARVLRQEVATDWYRPPALKIEFQASGESREEYNRRNNIVENINTWTFGDFLRLERVGYDMAQRILDYREEHGPFESIEDLLNVYGFGQKLLERNRELLLKYAPD